jgi:predicted transcriptional regulator
MDGINIPFSSPAYEKVSELAEKLHISKSEIIREALSLYSWAVNEYTDGNHLLIERGEITTEIVIDSFKNLSKSE